MTCTCCYSISRAGSSPQKYFSVPEAPPVVGMLQTHTRLLTLGTLTLKNGTFSFPSSYPFRYWSKPGPSFPGRLGFLALSLKLSLPLICPVMLGLHYWACRLFPDPILKGHGLLSLPLSHLPPPGSCQDSQLACPATFLSDANCPQAPF